MSVSEYQIKYGCPCCNHGLMTVFEFEPDDLPTEKTSCTVYQIVCQQCGMRTGFHNTIEKAIEVWDRRDFHSGKDALLSSVLAILQCKDQTDK